MASFHIHRRDLQLRFRDEHGPGMRFQHRRRYVKKQNPSKLTDGDSQKKAHAMAVSGVCGSGRINRSFQNKTKQSKPRNESLWRCVFLLLAREATGFLAFACSALTPFFSFACRCPNADFSCFRTGLFVENMSDGVSTFGVVVAAAVVAGLCDRFVSIFCSVLISCFDFLQCSAYPPYRQGLH